MRVFRVRSLSGQINWCGRESEIEISLMSDTRIEGVTKAQEKYDCRKCKPEGNLISILLRGFLVEPECLSNPPS